MVEWLLIEIGCLECGGSSWMVGSYPSEELAHAAAGGLRVVVQTREAPPYPGEGEWHGDVMALIVRFPLLPADAS